MEHLGLHSISLNSHRDAMIRRLLEVQIEHDEFEVEAFLALRFQVGENIETFRVH